MLTPFNHMKIVLFKEASLSETLSEGTILETIPSPAKPSPWKARPSNSMGQSCAPAPRALPISTKNIEVAASVNAVTIQLG